MTTVILRPCRWRASCSVDVPMSIITVCPSATSAAAAAPRRSLTSRRSTSICENAGSPGRDRAAVDALELAVARQVRAGRGARSSPTRRSSAPARRRARSPRGRREDLLRARARTREHCGRNAYTRRATSIVFGNCCSGVRGRSCGLDSPSRSVTRVRPPVTSSCGLVRFVVRGGGRSAVKRFGGSSSWRIAAATMAAPALGGRPLHGLGQSREDQRDGRVGPSGRRHEHHRAVRRLASALRRQVRDHHGHPRRGRRQRRRHRDRPGARPAARERGPRRALPLGHGRHLQPRPRRLLLQPERAADAVLLGPGRDAAPRHADHPHDAAGHLHRLHADARRRPRQPPAGRPLHLGGRQGRGRPDDVPGAADRAERARAPGRSRRSSPAAATAGTGGTTTAADCTTGFIAAPATRHRRGRLDGLRLAVPVARRQRPGHARGHAEDLGAGRLRGRVAPTRRRAA